MGSVLRRSFTLIEMVVVISIILVISSVVLPAVSTMWNQASARGANQKINNLLKIASLRSKNLQHVLYGVLFYIDPLTNREVAVFIDGLMRPVFLDETWPDVCDRFIVDTKNRYFFSMQDSVRISPSDVFEWDGVDLLNNDYRSGKQRNFFAIVFRRGHRASSRPYILYDEDKDKDGLGDTLGLPVGNTIGDYGGLLRDIVLDSNGERQIIPTDWGFLIYSESLFKEFSPDNLDLVPYSSYSLTRYGKAIAREK